MKLGTALLLFLGLSLRLYPWAIIRANVRVTIEANVRVNSKVSLRHTVVRSLKSVKVCVAGALVLRNRLSEYLCKRSQGIEMKAAPDIHILAPRNLKA